jgi:DNA-binding Lrp family transcriptional regulator
VSQARSFSGQGSNSSLIGDFNARVILTALRRGGPASKADLSRMVGLTQNATGLIVRRLEQGGLVRNVGKRHGERGQPATILELNPDGAFSIGVRIDRTVLETVLVDLRGQILDRDTLATLPEPDAAITHLTEVIARMTGRLKPAHRARLTGIGIATPYNLDSWLKELHLPAARFRRWGGFNVQTALSLSTGYHVVLENDGSAAAIGELIYGHGREIADFLYVFVGPAIGGGVVLGGDYFRGARRNAALDP